MPVPVPVVGESAGREQHGGHLARRAAAAGCGAATAARGALVLLLWRRTCGTSALALL
jgi:hypothetical protein